MSKFLKRYNETTGTWELVSAPDVSVVQQLEGGSDITDTNVVISNVNYAKESGKTTLDETLTEISDDISRLQRNVSWLAEHGGGGGAGGGGDQKSFGIVIISPVLNDNAAYVSGKTFDIEFTITGGTEGDECQYAYVYDSNPQTDYAIIKVNESVKISIDNTESQLKEHSIIIRAINPYGTNITAKSFRIYESTLSLAFDVESAGDDYKNGVFNVRQNSTYAYIPLLITNGLMNSRTVITSRYSDVSPKSIEFTNETTSPQQIKISLWDIAPKNMFNPGEYYVITFNSSATLGSNTINSNEVQLRIRIVSPTEISIILGVNGTTGELIEAPLNSTIVYNFKAYVPVFTPPVESTYYSAKIVNGSNSYLILGKYYDNNTCIEGSNYNDNDSISVGSTVSSQYTLNNVDFSIGNNIELYVKVWNLSGDKSAETKANIIVTEESNEVFPRQSNPRGNVGDTGNTVLLSWNKGNAAASSPTKWTSKVIDYAFMDDALAESEHNTVIADINVFNGNAESRITIDEQYGIPYLRLQNRAYATADVSYYYNEIQRMTANDSENYGFTISFTVMQDAHNDNKHTLLLWGENASDGTLTNGIRIDTDKAYWAVNERTSGGSINKITISCPIASKAKTTVDFSYVRTTNGTTVRIYLNGILNAASDIYMLSGNYTFPSKIYFGVNSRSGQLERYSDLSVYEFSVYTKSLNDLQTIVNGKNARYTTLEDYNDWKVKNFITAKSTDLRVPESVFFENGNYITEFDAQQINNIAARSNIPTLYLNFGQSAGFNAETFYRKYTTSATGTTYPGTATYYDPSTQGTADNIAVLVSLQGTSTLGYRIKNLELYIDESFVDPKTGDTKKKLFQPKKEWFPESQFTLKADVVDSAHANNAVLGEWINNCGLFENNPAMAEFEGHRPEDIDDSGTTYGIDTDVTIKHTLEGFPFLMFIKFSDQASYTFLGIYSFNLGRYSYYNMGMKFLKSFSRRNGIGPGSTKVSCPKIINYYEEMDNLGSVSGNNIYSFEMGNAGNGKVAEYPVWSQYTTSVVQSYGDFKYPSNVTDNIWNKLCDLFKAIAEFRITSYSGNLYDKYDGIKIYRIENGEYVTDGIEVDQKNDSIADIDSRTEGGHLNIKNAMSYFIVANAFGMTDSLGKNLTLRTWDGGETWYCCFYDMDTALGLANDGSESNPVTVAIDKVEMVSDPATHVSTLYTTYHDDDSKYAAVLSKIWGVLRDDRFFYLNNNDITYTYEYIWGELRKIGGKLSKSANFTDIMAARVDSCGEMIYDYDYNTKYIQDTEQQESGGAAAITFLHGTRVDYVKEWLKKHFYFLDGMFDASRFTGITFTYEDSPYNSDILTLAVNYSSSLPVLPYTVQVSTPTFIGLSVGNDAFKKYYVENENTDTVIYLINGTSANSQISIKSSTLLTKFEGLSGGFLSIGSNPNGGEAKSLSEFNVSNSYSLNENPLNIDRNGGIFGKESSLEKINLSNTRGVTTLQEYGVYLEPFNKLIDIDVSNSDVTSLSLPSTALQRLRITRSNIANFTIKNQNVINEISFDGCNKLQTISIDKCDAVESLIIDDKPILGSVIISNCRTLTSVTISNCGALYSVDIANNPNLEYVKITNCDSPTLEIRLYGSKLKYIELSNLTETTKAITLPARSDMDLVTSFTISNCYKISGIHYLNSEIETYKESEVFDLSPMTSLQGVNLVLRNILVLKYLRVANDDGTNPVEPFELQRDAFYGCNNLERIFGYISIKSSPFAGLTKFKINEDNFMPNDGIPTVPFVLTSENPYYTNVKINSTSLNGWFERTNCDIHDAYYILQLCDDSIVSLDGLFKNCPNIVTSIDEPIDENTFSKLSGETVSIKNINNLFNGCHINGRILPGLFPVNLMKNITEFNNVLSGDYSFDSDDTLFPEGNKIKSITGYNPKNIEGVSNYFKDSTLLTTLTELVSIENSFNRCGIDFESGGAYDAREMFKYNTKLVNISESFNELENCFGSIKNIFGGDIEDENNEFYPRQLSSVTNSFTFKTGSHDPELTPLYEDDYGEEGIIFPIGNSFLSKIANSIVYITGNHPGENSTYSDMACFTGPGIIKYIDDIDNGTEYMKDDCEGKHFPYKIFKGCKKLREFPNLFEDVQNFTRDEDGIIVPITINLLDDGEGHSIFEDCISLENVSKMFYNMASKPESGKIYAKLNGKAFKNCKIKNAELIFSTKNTGRYEIIDMLPYGLFYQEKEELYPKQSGLTESQASAYGITEDSGTLSELNDYTVFSGTYKAINGTIKHMPSCLSNLKSSTLKPYTANIITYEDVTEDNPNYNPLKYLLNGLDYTINPDYNKYKKIWNKYVFDGSEDFYRYFVRSDEKYIGIFEIIDEYGNPIVNESEMPVQFTQGYIDANNVENFLDSTDIGSDDSYGRVTSSQIKHNIFGVRNYFCPPDIFRYCEDTARTNIDNAFAGSSGDYNDSISDNYGLRGTIPEFIFEPLSKIQGMSGVFVSFKMLLPYKWRKVDGGITTEYGVTYPPMLFSGLTNTFSITSVFSDTRVWGNTIIPSGLFTSPSVELSDVSGMWSSAKWIDRTIQQLPSDILYSCHYLRNISGMLADSGNLSIYFITSDLVTVLRNSYLNNCTKFLYQATSTTGSVPELWNWPSTQLTNYYYALKGVDDGSRITNYDAAKFEKFVRDM